MLEIYRPESERPEIDTLELKRLKANWPDNGMLKLNSKAWHWRAWNWQAWHYWQAWNWQAWNRQDRLDLGSLETDRLDIDNRKFTRWVGRVVKTKQTNKKWGGGGRGESKTWPNSQEKMQILHCAAGSNSPMVRLFSNQPMRHPGSKMPDRFAAVCIYPSSSGTVLQANLITPCLVRLASQDSEDPRVAALSKLKIHFVVSCRHRV